MRPSSSCVPASVFELGAKGLKSARGGSGSFTYGEGRGPGNDNNEALKNAMARMPICERALMFATEGQDTAALAVYYDEIGQSVPPPGLIQLGVVDAGVAEIADAGRLFALRIDRAPNTGT